MVSIEIDSIFLDLQSLVVESNPANERKAANLIVDISQIFSNLTNDTESIVDRISIGLIQFLRSTKNNIFDEAKKDAVEIIKVLVERKKFSLTSYADDFLQIGIAIYSSSSKVDLRSIALNLVCSVASNFSQTVRIQDFKPKQLIHRLCLDIKSSSQLLYYQLATIGELFYTFSSETKQHNDLVYKILKENLIQKSYQNDFRATSGAIRGLQFYFHRCENEELFSEVFPHVFKLINPNLKLHRRDVQRAALQFLSTHGDKFWREVYNKHEILYSWLIKWCNSTNSLDYKAGVQALNSFILVLSKALVQLKHENETELVLKDYLKKFSVYLESNESKSLVNVSMKGYGVLATPSRIVLGSESVEEMLYKVTISSQKVFFESQVELESRILDLCCCLENLGLIIFNLDHITIDTLDNIQRLCVTLIQIYPSTDENKVFLVHRALFTVFVALFTTIPQVFDNFIKVFVRRLVIQTCIQAPPHKTVISTFSGDKMQSKKSWKPGVGLKGETITYKNFIPLWDGLLRLEEVRDLKILDINTFQLITVCDKLYEQFLNCVYQLTDELDLRLVSIQNVDKNEPAEYSTSDENPELTTSENEQISTSSKPKNVQDFESYVNLSFLMEEILPFQLNRSLKKHLPTIVSHFVLKSSEQPYVVTHYSVLYVIISSANQLNFFDETSQIVQETTELFTKYLNRILRIFNHFKNEVLVACLTLILQTPARILCHIIEQLVLPMKLALKIGLSYFPIADLCVTALQNWSDVLSKKDKEILFSKILCHLLPYLRSKESLSEIESSSKALETKMSLARQRRKIDRKQLSKTRIESASEMRKIQLAIVHLLGSLDHDLMKRIVDPNGGNEKTVRNIDEETDRFDLTDLKNSMTSWDHHKHVKFTLPLANAKFDIYLDSLLPPVIEKCQSTDRSTKIAACELLHSIVIIMIGIGNLKSEATHERTPMAPLYSRVFAAMLRLSVDSDQVTRQLFLTLTFQSIHWFAKSNYSENPDTVTLLNAIVEGIANSSDPTLRTFCCECLCEFVKWAKKQSKSSQQFAHKSKWISKRIVNLLRHPSYHRKLGGCLSWSAVYVELREDANWCDTWSLDLLVALYSALTTSDGNEDDGDSVQLLTHDDSARRESQKFVSLTVEGESGIMRVLRILIARKDLLNKASDNRRIPTGFKAGTLSEILSWLFDKIWSKISGVRHISFKLISSLARHTTGYSGTREYINQSVNTLTENLRKNFFIFDDKDFLEHGFKIEKSVLEKFRSLLCCLEVLIWCITENFSKILENPQIHKIFEQIKIFIKTVQIKNEKTEFNEYKLTKCSLIVRIFDILSVLPHSFTNLMLGDETDAKNVLDLVLMCSFHPNGLGFDTKDREIQSQLPVKINQTFKSLKIKIKNENFKEFKKHLMEKLQKIDLFCSENLDFDEKLKKDWRNFIFELNSVENLIDSGWISNEDEVVKIFVRILQNCINILLKCDHQDCISVENNIFKCSSQSEVYFKSERSIYDVFSTIIKVFIRLETFSCSKMLLSYVFVGSNSSVSISTSGSLSRARDVILRSLFSDSFNCVKFAVEKLTEGKVIPSLNLLEDFLKMLIENRTLRKEYSSKFALNILNNWPNIQSCCDSIEKKKCLLSVVMNLILTDSSQLVTKKHLEHVTEHDLSILHFSKSFLMEPSIDLMSKTNALKLLPFLLSEKHAANFVNLTLKPFCDIHLSITSKIEKGSLKERETEGILREILLALELTGSLPLLGLVCELSNKITWSKLHTLLHSCLKKLAKNSNAVSQIAISDFLFKRFCDNFSLDVIDNFLMIFLMEMTEVAISGFFSKNLKELLSFLSNAKQNGNERNLNTKYALFSLCQILYSRLPKESIFAPQCELALIYSAEDKTGKELTKYILKNALNFYNQKPSISGIFQDQFRICACAAYNAVISILTNVQDESKFYDQFLFDKTCWSNLIDMSKNFTFDAEVNFETGYKTKSVAVRKSKVAEDSFGDSKVKSSQRNFSRNTGSSSWLEDAAKYDFSTSVVLSQNFAEFPKAKDERESRFELAKVHLDQSDFNNHEIMPNLISVIRHMFEREIVTTHASKQGDVSESEIPNCILFIVKKLRHYATEKNLKIYLLRLIMNLGDVLKPYRRVLVDPILHMIRSGLLGNDINYFISDLFTTVVDWREVGIPKSKEMASNALSFLIKNSPHTRADIFKYNITLIKSVVESWGNIFDCPCDVILRLIQTKNGKKREVEAGLKACAILLTNESSLFRNSELKAQFESELNALLKHSSSGIHIVAAEVIGILLESNANSNLEETVNKTILSLIQNNKTLSHSLNIIYFMHNHYPKIVNTIALRIMNILPTLYGINRDRMLECLAAHFKTLDNVFGHLKDHKILENLVRKEAKTQLASISLLNGVLDRLSEDQIKYFLPGIISLEKHPSDKVREEMYKAFILIFNSFKDSIESSELLKNAQVMLLKGTRDDNISLRNTIRNFWVDLVSNMQSSERLVFALKWLYAPETESYFLHMATNIILHASFSTPDFLRPIFEHPLTECPFIEMKVSADWKLQHASLVPLLDNTQASQEFSMYCSQSTEEGVVQGTQAYEFEATQQTIAVSSTFDWVSGTAPEASKETQTSSVLQRFKNDKITSDSSLEENSASRLSGVLLRRRFVAEKDRKEISAKFARVETKKKSLQLSIDAERHKRKSTQVTIYRRYRIGELPDVQIARKSLISPLQALAEKDDQVASILFEIICQRIIEESPDLLGVEESLIWKDKIFDFFRIIVNSSEICDHWAIRSILSLCLENNVILNPKILSVVAIKSQCAPLGILCLERQICIIQSQSEIDTVVCAEPTRKKLCLEPVQTPRNTDGPSLKKIKFDNTVSQNKDFSDTWLSVADMYRSLCMFDSVLGILKHHVKNLKKETLVALEAESKNDYSEAHLQYKTAIFNYYTNSSECETPVYEKALWQQYFIKNAESLGQWDDIDSFLSDFLLPREESKVNQLLKIYSLPTRSISSTLSAAINSNLVKSLSADSGNYGNILCGFVDSSFKTADHRFILENTCPTQLAALAINQKKHEMANNFLKCAQLKVIEEISKCSVSSKESVLYSLRDVQILSEMHDYLQILNSNSQDKVSLAKSTVLKLRTRQIGIDKFHLQTLLRSLFRYQHLRLLKAVVKEDLLEETSFLSCADAVQFLLANSNHLMANLTFLKIESLGKSKPSRMLLTSLMKAEIFTSRFSGRPTFNRLLATWQYVKSKASLYQVTVSCDLKVKWIDLNNKLYQSTIEFIRTRSHETSETEKFLNLCELLSVECDNSVSFYRPILTRVRNNIEEVDKILSVGFTKSNDVLKFNEASHWASVSKFYELALEDWSDYILEADFVSGFIRSVLKGMKCGSADDHFRMPKLIHMIEKNRDMISVFKSYCSGVPTWMFLLWINHILIYLDKNSGSAFYNIVEKIASCYPQAIIYSFQICKETYNMTNPGLLETCTRVENVLRNEILIQNFIGAMSLIKTPFISIKNAISKTFKFSTIEGKQRAIRKCYEDFFNPVASSSYREKGLAYLNSEMVKCKNILEEFCGENLRSLETMSRQELNECASKVTEFLKTRKKTNKYVKISDYSPWLAMYKAGEHLSEIEIPGQYQGLYEPLPQYHKKIMSFDPKVTILTSLREPIKITAVASDHSEKSFLVKSGEDLQTDERIQSLFLIMNQVYQSFSTYETPIIKTFSVIPFSRQFGLLDWVDSTQVLEGFMRMFLSKKESSLISKAYEVYKKSSSNSNKKECVRNFTSVVNSLPEDFLLRTIYGKSANYEGFFHLRSNFISSLATMSISHWLLGIGDRHLNNSLIDSDCKFVGIDFGMHFEAGIQFLPVPELVPFRLTNQMLNVMQPIGHCGQYRETLIACLTSLKQKRHILVAAIQTFVEQPTDNWLEFATLSSKFQDLNSFSRSKLNDFSRKLKGVDPGKIIVSALSKNERLNICERSELISHIDDRRHNLAESSNKFKVEEQVDILIDLATDHNLLGRMYEGWHAFL